MYNDIWENIMGFKKQIESKKAVTVQYWHLVSLGLNDAGTLRMNVAGYRDGASYAAGADPIDEYECVVSNADVSLKAPFYDLLEQCFPLFGGAEKDLSYSGQTTGPQTMTVQTAQGVLIQQSTAGDGDAAGDTQDFGQVDGSNDVADEDSGTAQAESITTDMDNNINSLDGLSSHNQREDAG
jgi:hypothetical protein